MAHPVVHWEIAAKDAGKLREFYAKLFDWRVNVDQGGYAMVEPGGEGGIGGGIMQAQGDVPSYVTVYVQVDDLQSYLDRAVSLGGTAVVPPTPIPGIGAFAMFLDPEQHLIGLFKE